MRIVVALDPDPFSGTGQLAQHGAFVFVEAIGGVAVVEGIAQRDDALRRVSPRERGNTRQRGARVVRRQQLSAPREARTFFQMQVGEDQRALVGPIERAEAIGVEGDAVHRHAAVRDGCGNGMRCW